MPAQGKQSTRKGLGTTRGTARTRPSEADAQSASTSKPVSKTTLNNTSAEQTSEKSFLQLMQRMQRMLAYLQ